MAAKRYRCCQRFVQSILRKEKKVRRRECILDVHFALLLLAVSIFEDTTLKQKYFL